jgi:peptidoglycan lytic transglycosylase
MRTMSIAAVIAFMAIHVSPALAQDFDERWSIIPKAHAEPPPKSDDQTVPQSKPSTAPEGIPRSDNHSPPRFSIRIPSAKLQAARRSTAISRRRLTAAYPSARKFA